MTDTTKTKEMTTKSSCKHVRFNPIVTYIDKQSLHPADISDQQEKIQTSSPKKSSTVTDVKTKNNCKVVRFNPAIFNTKAPELADQMNKQHKTKEPLTKGSENTKAPVPDNEKRSENTSHLVEVKTRKKYWKRIQKFFSNINWFGFCTPTNT
ncbi:hypothetical protein XENORESO_004570 [Xenotaenia resolanae]|uniref:Uncharacterized protein n=1 Tax=Xenotaenia resolanae TaxID=208358 RepID=A0ABV0X0U6_9TELE